MNIVIIIIIGVVAAALKLFIAVNIILYAIKWMGAK